MPIYDFQCNHPLGCKKVTEEIVSYETKEIICDCGRLAERVTTTCQHLLKGLPTPIYHNYQY
jgi:hypothetical protein